jgi:hypothetical protein
VKRRSLLGWLASFPFIRLARAEVPKPRLCIWASTRNAGNVVAAQRGDVVDVLDTLRHPGREVLGHPDWRIVDVDIQVDNPLRAMAWLIAPDDAPEGYLRWFRRQTVDLDALERATERRMGRSLAADDILSVTHGALTALAKVKLSLPDPRIIRA